MGDRADLPGVLARIPDIECKGKCHESCGGIMVSREEQDLIRDWCRKNGVRYHPLPQNPITLLRQALNGSCSACKYLTEDKRCSIHPVRPVICRLFGVTESMPCPFGCKPDRTLAAEEGYMMLNDAGHDNAYPRETRT